MGMLGTRVSSRRWYYGSELAKRINDMERADAEGKEQISLSGR